MNDIKLLKTIRITAIKTKRTFHALRQTLGKASSFTGLILPYISPWIMSAFCFVILILALRGFPGNPTAVELTTKHWQNDGPFELSPERGRFALAYSIIENKSFFYSVPLARFALPDLGYANGHYVSLFAPGVSYLVIPGYMIGKALGSAQLGAYSIIALFAVLNFFFIKKISEKLNLHPMAATAAGLIFLFATPAFNYGVTLYQHHISTFLILSATYLLFFVDSFWALALVWFLCAASIPIDYPNLFLMMPLGLVGLGRILSTKPDGDTVIVRFHFLRALSLAAAILPLLFFLWFNKQSYNNPFQFSGTITSVKDIDKAGNPIHSLSTNPENLEKQFNTPKQSRSALGFFQSRDLINGLYIHIFSPDRGIIRFTPIMLLFPLGYFFLKKKNIPLTLTLSGVAVADLVLYSLWGDPWGGWAFGSRYLIPLYAVGSIGIAQLLHTWRKNILFLVFFAVLAGYSVVVNTSGALTSSANPPRVEVLNLEKISGIQQRFSFDRNIYELKAGASKSFAYQTWFHNRMSAYTYFKLIAGVIIAAITIQLVILKWKQEPSI